jgi:hypothetical protein
MGEGGGLFGFFFGEQQERPLPVINYFLTDGENADVRETQKLFEEIEKNDIQIYYVLIGLGNSKYDFLRQSAKRFPNVGFVSVNSLTEFLSDETIYEKLLPSELCAWLKHEHEEGEDDEHH